MLSLLLCNKYGRRISFLLDKILLDNILIKLTRRKEQIQLYDASAEVTRLDGNKSIM